jgi:hypothetical protein
MLNALDVIWVDDDYVNPAKKKMWVCICSEDNLFYRINSHNDFPIGVLLPKEPHHSDFLIHDSYLECGRNPLELDDFSIQKSLDSNNGKPTGRIHNSYAKEIFDAIQLQPTISKELKQIIRASFKIL